MAAEALSDPTGLSVPFGLDVDPTGFDQGAGLLDKLSKKLGGVHGFDIDVNPAKAVAAMQQVFSVVDQLQHKWSQFAVDVQGFKELGLSGVDYKSMTKNVDDPDSLFALSGISSDQLIAVMQQWQKMAVAAILEGKDEYSDFALGAKYFNFDANYIKDAIVNKKTPNEILIDVLNAVQEEISKALDLPADKQQAKLSEIVGKAALIGLPEQLTSSIIKYISTMKSSPNVSEVKLSDLAFRHYASDIMFTPGANDVMTDPAHAVTRAEQKRANQNAKERRDTEAAYRTEHADNIGTTWVHSLEGAPYKLLSWLSGHGFAASGNTSADIAAASMLTSAKAYEHAAMSDPKHPLKPLAKRYEKPLNDLLADKRKVYDLQQVDYDWLVDAVGHDNVEATNPNTGQIILKDANKTAISRNEEMFAKLKAGTTLTLGDWMDYLIPQLMVTAGEQSVDALSDVFFAYAGQLQKTNPNYQMKTHEEIASELYKVYAEGSADTTEDDYRWNNLARYFETDATLSQQQQIGLANAIAPLAMMALQSSGMLDKLNYGKGKDNSYVLNVRLHGDKAKKQIQIDMNKIFAGESNVNVLTDENGSTFF